MPRSVIAYNNRAIFLLKASFLIGAIADFIVGVNWCLISIGKRVPNLMSGYMGDGYDYQFAMYIATMFMFGWTAILFWGYWKPIERRDLLLITSGLLLISITVELMVFSHRLTEISFLFPYIRRFVLLAFFAFSYFYSKRNPSNDASAIT